MHTILVLAMLCFTPLHSSSRAATAELTLKLNTTVNQYHLKALGLADAFTKIADQFRLPMGIEWVKDKGTVRGLNLAWKDETLTRILSAVIKQYPGYAFEIEGGVVHVFRQDLVNNEHNFLNRKVPDWLEARQEVGGIINQRLQEAAQNIVAPHTLPPGAGEGFEYATGVSEKPLTVRLRGKTIREALVELAGKSEHKIWIVTFTASSTLTPTGFLRTETLWHPSPLPDSEQPMWDLLTWKGNK